MFFAPIDTTSSSFIIPTPYDIKIGKHAEAYQSDATRAAREDIVKNRHLSRFMESQRANSSRSKGNVISEAIEDILNSGPNGMEVRFIKRVGNNQWELMSDEKIRHVVGHWFRDMSPLSTRQFQKGSSKTVPKKKCRGMSKRKKTASTKRRQSRKEARPPSVLLGAPSDSLQTLSTEVTTPAMIPPSPIMQKSICSKSSFPSLPTSFERRVQALSLDTNEGVLIADMERAMLHQRHESISLQPLDNSKASVWSMIPGGPQDDPKDGIKSDCGIAALWTSQHGVTRTRCVQDVSDDPYAPIPIGQLSESLSVPPKKEDFAPTLPIREAQENSSRYGAEETLNTTDADRFLAILLEEGDGLQDLCSADVICHHNCQKGSSTLGYM